MTTQAQPKAPRKLHTQTVDEMAGRVRHPIDQAALERYIEKNVPEIKTPIDIKQVRNCARRSLS